MTQHTYNIRFQITGSIDPCQVQAMMARVLDKEHERNKSYLAVAPSINDIEYEEVKPAYQPISVFMGAKFRRIDSHTEYILAAVGYNQWLLVNTTTGARWGDYHDTPKKALDYLHTEEWEVTHAGDPYAEPGGTWNGPRNI